jgi:Uma2 family endonuclease
MPSPLYRMSVEEYEAMVASGAFQGRRRLHLINGLLVEKMTQNPPHAIAFILCGDQLDRVTPIGWHVRSAQPIRLSGQDSEPEPDHCIVRGAVRDYLAGHPGPADIALVVEISDTSLAADRDYAARLYGPAGIPVCWIVNLIDRVVEVYTRPGPGGYASRRVPTRAGRAPGDRRAAGRRDRRRRPDAMNLAFSVFSRRVFVSCRRPTVAPAGASRETKNERHRPSPAPVPAPR